MSVIEIDLGLKTLATDSNGKKFEPKQWYPESEALLGIAQRARNKNCVKAIHTKIANHRKDAIHKENNTAGWSKNTPSSLWVT